MLGIKDKLVPKSCGYHDMQRCKHMLASYDSKVQEARGAGSKRPVWCLLKYVEEVDANSAMVFRDHGIMMWKRQAIKFWESIDGGELTEEEANQKWRDMASNYEEQKRRHVDTETRFRQQEKSQIQ